MDTHETIIPCHYHVVWYIEPQLQIIPSEMYSERRFIPACTATQPDQSLSCTHKETLHPRLSKMRKCAGLSESSLGTYLKLFFLMLLLIPFHSILLGPVVESFVSLTSSLVVKMLTVLVSTIFNSQVFLLKKNESCKKYF